jgi:molybdate transport repressor ModE-like protein/molybdopterin-binding protein
MSKPINHYLATVLSVGPAAAGVVLRLGRRRVRARHWPGCRAGQRVRVRIRPEEVLLAVGGLGEGLSAQNVLPGKILGLSSQPEGVYVRVNLGFILHSLIALSTVQRLGLKAGRSVQAVFKTMAVEAVPDGQARLAVVLRGRHGALRQEQMDLLRQVHGSGSLSAAAKGLGISYRTAWLWARALNRAFERPLLVPVHGGRRGGGCVLSSEARAWLRRAEALEWAQRRP